jgi:hypothetical protein
MKWESDCAWGWNIEYSTVGATGVAQRWPFQTNVGWLNTPNYESDGKIEETEGPSTVLTMRRLWLCREECLKSTFVLLLHSPLEVGPPLERWAAMFCSLP